MQFEDYRKLKYPTPYVYKLLGKRKELLYYGSAHHSADPQNPMFTDIEEKFLEFNPDIALFEGEAGPSVSRSKEEAVRRGGEAEFVAFLCSRRNIKTLSATLPVPREIELLTRKFSREEVFLYLVARFLSYRFRVGKSVTKDFLEKSYLPWCKKRLGWSDFEFSLENLEKIYLKVLGQSLDLADEGFWRDASNPTKDISVLNEIARKSGDLRDGHTVTFIRGLLKSYNRVFVVMGSAHARRQEPHLRDLIAE